MINKKIKKHDEIVLLAITLIWLTDILTIYLEKQIQIKYYVIKHFNF